MLCKCGHFSIDHSEIVDVATRQIGACKFCLCPRFEAAQTGADHGD